MLEKMTSFIKNIYWIPLVNIEIPVKQNIKDAIKLLSIHVGKRPLFNFGPFGKDRKFFIGEISNHTFKIRRYPYFGKLFLPELSGKFENHGDGSLLKIKFHLQQSVITNGAS